MKHEIIINRMFSGEYLKDEHNIGHEIINLYKPDHGNQYYIYLVPSGDYAAEHHNTEIDGILLIRGIRANCVEVLAKVTGIHRVFNSEPGKKRNWIRLKDGEEFNKLAENGAELTEIQKAKRENLLAENAYQKRYIREYNIRYGNVLMDQLFANNPDAKYNLSLYMTFAADHVQKVKEPFYLVTDEKEKIPGKVNIVINRGRLSGSASATFYGEKEEDNYNLLKEILFGKAELWGEDVEKFDPAKISENDTFSFFSIARKEYDELAYSNAFAYFFDKYGVLLDAVGNVVREKYAVDICTNHQSANVQIYREKENIDILIASRDTKSTVVIENKIKSGIHGEKHDLNGSYIKNQLDKYHEYVETEYPANEGYRNHYLLFLPDYNIIRPEQFETVAQKAFKPVYFSELYQAFTQCQEQNTAIFAGDMYWQDFLRAIKKHSSKYDNNFEGIMKQKMKRLIDNAVSSGYSNA